MTTTDRDIIRVTDDATRAEIAEAIAALRVRQRRLPAHFVDAIGDLADEIDLLVEDFLNTPES